MVLIRSPFFITALARLLTFLLSSPQRGSKFEMDEGDADIIVMLVPCEPD